MKPIKIFEQSKDESIVIENFNIKTDIEWWGKR